MGPDVSIISPLGMMAAALVIDSCSGINPAIASPLHGSTVMATWQERRKV